MRYVTQDQIEQIKANIVRKSTSPERDLLLINMSVDMGIKSAHLAAIRVNEVLEQSDGDVVRAIGQTPIPEKIREDIAKHLRNRFRTNHQSLRSVPLHLFTNRETRGHFSDQSMAVHLSFLIKRAGVNATATCLRNSFIRNCALKGNASDLVRLTGIRNPATVFRYLLSEYEEVGGIQI